MTRRPRSGLRGTRLTLAHAGSRRNPPTPIDVCVHSREHENGARQDSKRKVMLTLTPMCWKVPRCDRCNNILTDSDWSKLKSEGWVFGIVKHCSPCIDSMARALAQSTRPHEFTDVEESQEGW